MYLYAYGDDVSILYAYKYMHRQEKIAIHTHKYMCIKCRTCVCVYLCTCIYDAQLKFLVLVYPMKCLENTFERIILSEQ